MMMIWKEVFLPGENSKKATATGFVTTSANSGNTSGMKEDLSSADDDWALFYSIQIERYLKRKVQKRFCSEAEKDVIKDIIAEYWHCFNDRIPKKSSRETKIHLFYSFVLVYPYFVVEEERVIPVDFRRKAIIHEEDTCFCGSGVPYYDCCGRIPDAEDFLNGSF